MRKPAEKRADVQVSLNAQLIQALADVQSVLHSPALNGGFEKLMFKVEKIEESQVKLVEKVDAIHDAVYDPDTGLFARIKLAENTKSEAIGDLRSDVASLQTWRETEAKSVEREVKTTEQHDKMVKDHDDQIRDIVKWRDKIVSGSKWLVISLVGGSLTFVGKLFYDFIANHVKLI